MTIQPGWAWQYYNQQNRTINLDRPTPALGLSLDQVCMAGSAIFGFGTVLATSLFVTPIGAFTGVALAVALGSSSYFLSNFIITVQSNTNAKNKEVSDSYHWARRIAFEEQGWGIANQYHAKGQAIPKSKVIEALREACENKYEAHQENTWVERIFTTDGGFWATLKGVAGHAPDCNALAEAQYKAEGERAFFSSFSTCSAGYVIDRNGIHLVNRLAKGINENSHNKSLCIAPGPNIDPLLAWNISQQINECSLRHPHNEDLALFCQQDAAARAIDQKVLSAYFGNDHCGTNITAVIGNHLLSINTDLHC